MRTNSLAKLGAILAICLGSLASSADVLKIVVDDTIHPLISEHIDRAIQEAQRTHATALLIELRTPGGLLSSTQDIVQKILASPVPVIIYVTPAGATAASAGFFILESADVAAMTPGTNTGVAHPVLQRCNHGPGDERKNGKLCRGHDALLLRQARTQRGGGGKRHPAIKIVHRRRGPRPAPG